MSRARFRLTPAHLDLLLACLADGDRASDAFTRWRPTVDLNDLDSGSHRLLPRLVDNLDGSPAIDADDVGRLRASARFSWLRSELHVSAARSAAALLRDAQIPTMAIKGLAILHHTGRPASIRPMDDADLLVPADRAADALRHLVGQGFTTWTRTDDDRSLRPLLAASHAVALEDARRAQVDLHWHALATSLHPRADDGLWARAQPSPGPASRVSDRESTVLHVLAHAGRYATSPAVSWVADLVDLVRTGPGLDWDHVLDQAQAHRLGASVNDALDLVQGLTLVDLPTRRAHLRPLDRAGHRVLSQAPGRLEQEARALAEQVSRTRPPGARVDPLAFARERWGRPRFRSAHPGLTGYEPGTAVDLTVGGSGLAALGSGWSFPEPHGTWTHGREAELRLRLARPATGPLLLRVQVTPLLAPSRPERDVDVVVAGQRVVRWHFTGSGWHSETRDVRLPALRSDVVDVRFVVHRPVSPQDLLVGMRSLPCGISVSSLVLLPA